MNDHSNQDYACGPVPEGYVTINEAARRLGLHRRSAELRISRGHLRTEQVMIPATLVPEAEVERNKRLVLKGGRPRLPEPDKETDYVGWLRWQQNEQRRTRRLEHLNAPPDPVPRPAQRRQGAATTPPGRRRA